MKIAIAGAGYVGLSLAVLLAQHNKVTVVDIVKEKVALVNQRKSPIVDKELEEYLSTKDLDLLATTDGDSAYADADYVIIAAPTNMNPRVMLEMVESSKYELSASEYEKIIDKVHANIASTEVYKMEQHEIKRIFNTPRGADNGYAPLSLRYWRRRTHYAIFDSQW